MFDCLFSFGGGGGRSSNEGKGVRAEGWRGFKIFPEWPFQFFKRPLSLIFNLLEMDAKHVEDWLLNTLIKNVTHSFNP